MLGYGSPRKQTQGVEENKQGQLSGFAGHTQGRQRQVREREQGLVQIVKGWVLGL